jgi:di/tricarboxylate transporter
MLVYRAAPMDWQGAFTIAVVLLTLLAMLREVAGPDIVMMGSLFVLAVTGILTPHEAFIGFSNKALFTIGFLFIVSAGLRDTGALDAAVGRLMSGARSERQGIARMCPPVALFSAFLNNAPIVAMMSPVITGWAGRHGFSPSKMLIPLSYASILGSTTTVIGTSTILAVDGLMQKTGMLELGFFELAGVGLPVACVGLVYLIVIAPRLLPEREGTTERLGDRWREYTAAMMVESDCPLIGQSIEEAGLRHLPGLFLVEIERSGHSISPVGPDEIIQAGDRLVFAGAVSTIVELHRIRGLVPVSSEETPVSIAHGERLYEVVVSSSSPLRGQSIRDANFRTVYDAAVIAVHRNGERVPGKIGEIVLASGDALLLQGAPGFLRAHRHSPDFYLVSEVQDVTTPRHERAWIAIVTLAVMVGLAALDLLPIEIASFGAVGVLLVSRCVTGNSARRSVDWSIVIVIGAGFGIAEAMAKTGAAGFIAEGITGAVGPLGPLATLAAVYAMTLLLAELLHHAAAVAIMFPIAIAAAGQVGADPRAFVICIAMAACCAFASPVTYQTHLIVYGPGGYRFADFIRVGLPLDLICAVVALTSIPMVWPL